MDARAKEKSMQAILSALNEADNDQAFVVIRAVELHAYLLKPNETYLDTNNETFLTYLLDKKNFRDKDCYFKAAILQEWLVQMEKKNENVSITPDDQKKIDVLINLTRNEHRLDYLRKRFATNAGDSALIEIKKAALEKNDRDTALLALIKTVVIDLGEQDPNLADLTARYLVEKQKKLILINLVKHLASKKPDERDKILQSGIDETQDNIFARSDFLIDCKSSLHLLRCAIRLQIESTDPLSLEYSAKDQFTIPDDTIIKLIEFQGGTISHVGISDAVIEHFPNVAKQFNLKPSNMFTLTHDLDLASDYFLESLQRLLNKTDFLQGELRHPNREKIAPEGSHRYKIMGKLSALVNKTDKVNNPQKFPPIVFELPQIIENTMQTTQSSQEKITALYTGLNLALAVGKDNSPNGSDATWAFMQAFKDSVRYSNGQIQSIDAKALETYMAAQGYPNNTADFFKNRAPNPANKS